MKRTTNGITIILFTAMAMIGGCTSGREGQASRNTLATAEETVKAYCDLDAQGARLTSETWSKVLPYIAWKEEAGWDRTIVISGYKIAKTRKQSETVSTIIVDYLVLGVVSGDYTQARRTEQVPFKVTRARDGWKITEPDFMPPHVLLKPMVKHLEGTKNLEMAGKLRAAPKE